MPIHVVDLYNSNPSAILTTGIGSTFVWTGDNNPTGTATITDNELGADGLTLDDDSAGAETATADVSIDGNGSTGSNVDAEIAWTVLDTVTGETFQVVQFEVESGGAVGFYTLSEQPLVEGRTYEVQAYTTNPDTTAGDPVFTYADYVSAPNIVEGTNANDIIDAAYLGDPEGDQIDDGLGGGVTGNDNIVSAMNGDDIVNAGAGDDTIYGGGGADTVDGGGGADVIYGDSNMPGVAAQSEYLDWSAAGADEADISAGFTQNTGEMDVTVNFTDDGDNNANFTVESNTAVYAPADEPFNSLSSGQLNASGSGPTSTVTIDFEASTGSSFADEVNNVSFRISDIDKGEESHVDVVQIYAYDASSNPVPVSITPSGNENVSGNTITAGGSDDDGSLDSPSSSGGSVLIEIDGPVSSVVVVYANAGSSGQEIFIGDVHFEMTETSPAANDSLSGGAGDDLIYGEAGDDTLSGGEGDDTLSGGDGDDVFVLQDVFGNDTILDFDIGDDDGDGFFNDQLDVSGLTDALGNPVNAWDATVSDDGGGNAMLTFPNGETVVLLGVAPASITSAQQLNSAGVPCFTRGTIIETHAGETLIEDLKAGDLVRTLDHGFQPIRWVGSTTVAAIGKNAPVLIRKGALGNARDLRVSPQHRMMLEGWRQELLFGEMQTLATAKSLCNDLTIRQVQGGLVEYFHMMFDQHEIVFSEGSPSESFHPGNVGMTSFPDETRDEIFSVFPQLHGNLMHYGPSARVSLKAYEVAYLSSTKKPRLSTGVIAERY